ncbi:MAG: 4-hydroxy-3-methylbut-2-enyl diphosphate reductase [Spirochaetia bacterium]|nr:4-hydroxy-3-methylbut-2-enyl diphosphate reductase [Spirochaetia bacterium]
MTILRAKVMGFCAGVRRAVLLAGQAAERADGHPVYSLGKIVHNKTVTNRLETMGISVLADDGVPPPGAIVVIRSHGVPPATLQRLVDNGATIVDASCPKVVANQRTAAAHAAAGRTVVIAGDEGHGEVLGLAGHAPGAVVIPDSRKALAWQHEGPVALIAQTTMSQAEVDGIAAALAENNADVIVAGGICGATADRQNALRELLPKVDAVVIVGGKDSANTRRLTAIAQESGKPVWQVANADEVSAGDLAGQLCRFERIGLSAGASTPDEDIDAVERRLMELAGEMVSGARGA